MIVTAWNNGLHLESGAGYGVKISIEDRDKHFNRDWTTIVLELEGEVEPVEINIDKPSFWNAACRELISQRIGIWLHHQGLAP